MSTVEEFMADLAAVRSKKKRIHRATPAAKIDRSRATNPYMLGRRAFVAGLSSTPPGEFTRDEVAEFRRGWEDGRRWYMRRHDMEVER